jgi:hypothetical protein
MVKNFFARCIWPFSGYMMMLLGPDNDFLLSEGSYLCTISDSPMFGQQLSK